MSFVSNSSFTKSVYVVSYFVLCKAIAFCLGWQCCKTGLVEKAVENFDEVTAAAAANIIVQSVASLIGLAILLFQLFSVAPLVAPALISMMRRGCDALSG